MRRSVRGAGSALLVVPGRSTRAAGVDARRIAADGLAAGLGAACGGVTFVAPGWATNAPGPAAVRETAEASWARSAVRLVPRSLRPGLGDLAAIRANRRVARALRSVDASRVGVVVQLHHRFQRAAPAWASRHRIPTIVRVEALEVREEREWGVRRPGYGGWVERRGELGLLRRADLVAPVSRELDAALEVAGIPPERRVVVPNGVDIERFRPGPPDTGLRRLVGLGERFTVGWIGGFRPFHGLEQLEAFVSALTERRPDAVVCLVGAGPLRDDLRERASRLGGAVVVAGPVPHDDVPDWIRSFDACVLFGPRGAFHYSPLKLFEYMACGRPVVVPAVGDVGSLVRDGRDGLVVPPGDPLALARAVARIAADPELAGRLGEGARRTAAARASWDARALELLDALELALDSRAPGWASV